MLLCIHYNIIYIHIHTHIISYHMYTCIHYHTIYHIYYYVNLRNIIYIYVVCISSHLYTCIEICMYIYIYPRITLPSYSISHVPLLQPRRERGIHPLTVPNEATAAGKVLHGLRWSPPWEKKGILYLHNLDVYLQKRAKSGFYKQKRGN